ncbi:MAG: FimV family protein [Burkholderiales bacterium]|nr:FimV family protein [Burkholderiales bacterium]
MRTFSLGKALAVALLLLAPWMAHAAGLGRLTVQSSLGQPLSAEIDLVAVRGDEASTLTVRLASPDAYQQANLQYNVGVTGIKLSIERRPNGQSFIKVTGSRPMNEPFVDLLVELSWSGGRIVREYTALLDPPGYGQQAQAVAAPAAAPAAPASKPIAAAPAVTPAPVAAPVAAAPKAQEYGPITRGETLGRIAASLKPQGVSLEQMLVGLYRSNPDAFIRNNLNLVKSGRILRVPDAQELAAISQGEAVKEYRAQVADWRAYSGRVADAAGQAPEGGATARGRITAKVDDPAAAESKDVVKLSKGEPGKGGKPLTGEAAARALQEELIARNKELAEAKERIAQLEKTIKDSQKLAELKSPALAAAQQKAEAAKADASKAVKPEPVKPEPAKPAEPAKDATAKPDIAKPEAKPDAPASDAKPDAAAPAVETPAEEAKPAPKPKPKPVAPPPPPPEPTMMDMAMDNLPLIGGGLGVLVLGGLGMAVMRRRRARAAEDDIEAVAPTFAAAAGTAAVVAAGESGALAPAAPATPAADEVDPVQEAEVYIAYGRDGQAEEILKEAMARNPAREDVQVKLAEVYAARQDSASFGTIAQSMNSLTGGSGDNWIKVAALGYALDPGNPLYAAGKDVAPAVEVSESATSTDLDFDLGGDSSSAPDIALDAEPEAGQSTEFSGTVQMAAAADAGVPPAEPAMTEFNLDLPAPGAQTDIALEAAPVESGSIDFNIELPAIDAPAAAPAAETPAPAADAGLDFKIDVGDLNINLDEPATTAAPAADKDSHWYDVQQKFDLAKAYQEMGDNDGAREILQEVLKEGDTEQKDQAQKLLSSLG